MMDDQISNNDWFERPMRRGGKIDEKSRKIIKHLRTKNSPAQEAQIVSRVRTSPDWPPDGHRTLTNVTTWPQHIYNHPCSSQISHYNASVKSGIWAWKLPCPVWLSIWIAQHVTPHISERTAGEVRRLDHNSMHKAGKFPISFCDIFNTAPVA